MQHEYMQQGLLTAQPPAENHATSDTTPLAHGMCALLGRRVSPNNSR